MSSLGTGTYQGFILLVVAWIRSSLVRRKLSSSMLLLVELLVLWVQRCRSGISSCGASWAQVGGWRNKLWDI